MLAQKKIRDEDLENIRKYTQDLDDLENEKLSLYIKQQGGQLDALGYKMDMYPNDKQKQADILKSGNEAAEQTKSYIDEITANRVARAQNEYDAIKAKFSSQLSGISLTEALRPYSVELANNMKNIYAEQDKLENEAESRLGVLYSKYSGFESKTASEAIDEFKKNVNENLEAYNELDKKFRENESNSWLGGMYALFHRDEAENLDKAKDNVFSGIDADSIQQIQNLFTVLSETKIKTGELSDEAKEQVNDIIPYFENLSKGVEPAGKEMFSKFIEGMVDEKGNLIDTADMSLKEMINTVRNTLEVASPDIAVKAKDIMTGAADAVKNGISNTNDLFKNFNPNGMTNSADNMSKKVGNSLTEMNNSSQRNSRSMRRTVETNATGMSTSVVLSVKNMSSQTVGNLRSMASNAINTVMQMRSNMHGIDLYSAGVNIMNGLINGMQSKLTALSTTANEAANTVKNSISQALDIHSPSRVLYKIGEYTGMGQINGMKSTLPEIQQTANKMGQKSVPNNSDDKKYSPSSSTVSYSRSSTSENVNYAPVFNLTISGTSDDRAMARKIKKMIGEAMEDMVSSYESKSRTVREV